MRPQRKLWLVGLGSLAIIGSALLLSPQSAARRLANLDVAEGGLEESFIMTAKSDAGRAYLTNRRGSTLRRPDRKESGVKRKLYRFHYGTDEAAPDTWMLQSKKPGTGTLFFIPVESVSDWTYPFLYRFIRNAHPDLRLPRVFWTELFVNRIYQGLYLRMDLPFDPRKKDGRTGLLRDILTVRGRRLTCVDTRFGDAPGLYMTAVEEGRFPELNPPPSALAWLDSNSPASETILLMDNTPPQRISLLPLPVSVSDLFEARHGRPPASFEDERYREWTEGVGSRRAEGDPALSKAERRRLEAEFADFSRLFLDALAAHSDFHRRPDLLTEAPSMGQAAAWLNLRLGE